MDRKTLEERAITLYRGHLIEAFKEDETPAQEYAVKILVGDDLVWEQKGFWSEEEAIKAAKEMVDEVIGEEILEKRPAKPFKTLHEAMTTFLMDTLQAKPVLIRDVLEMLLAQVNSASTFEDRSYASTCYKAVEALYKKQIIAKMEKE